MPVAGALARGRSSKRRRRNGRDQSVVSAVGNRSQSARPRPSRARKPSAARALPCRVRLLPRNRPARIRKEVLHKGAAPRSSSLRTISDQLPACRSRPLVLRLPPVEHRADSSERKELVSCTSDPSSCSLREAGTRAAQQCARGGAGLALAVLLGAACTGTIGPKGLGADPNPVGGGGTSGPSQGGGTSGSSQARRHVGLQSSRRHELKAEARREPAAWRPPSY